MLFPHVHLRKTRRRRGRIHAGRGPVGALIGALAGHFLIDREMQQIAPGDAPGVVFTIAMIALAAKMAKADGTVTDDEVETFHRLFRVTPGEQSSVDRVFRLAQQDTAGFEAYAGQIAKMLAGNPALLEDILDGLFEIAKPTASSIRARPRFSSASRTSSASRRTNTAASAPPISAPKRAIRMSCSASPSMPKDDEVRATYRMLVRENHPDKLIARGVPEEFIRLATDKLAVINGAYEKIEKERGWR